MTSVDLRCPACGSKLRGDESWCSLCHADLRAPAAPTGDVGTAVGPVPDAASAPVIDPLTAPVEELFAAGLDARPAADAAGVVDPLDAVVVGDAPDGADGQPPGRHARPGQPDGEDGMLDPDVMLAMLRASSRDPVLSTVGGRLDDPTTRFLVMIGGAGLLAGALFSVYVVLGALFG